MMTGAPDPNVHALAIDGNFDDCQAIVKQMFNHHAFRDRVGLSGVNSINFARIVAQVVYYFAAAVALGAPHRKVAFAVPTGNFGDVFAGYVAKLSPTSAPWMAIQGSSNFERLMFDAYGCDPQPVRGAMAALAQSGH